MGDGENGQGQESCFHSLPPIPYPHPMERREIRYTGRVQGVGFRATARSIARRHGVTGWVRNEADGSVRMQAQGEADAVARCLADLAGAMSGRIESSESFPRAPEPGEAAFEVRH